ncbi:MAG: TfoX/Sxy family protein [Anaerolineae bacterium]
MAYDAKLAERIRKALKGQAGLTEKQMFGGIGFMVHGNMACGVIGDELMVRVGPEAHDEALRAPSTRIFDFSGRPSIGWVMVAQPGLETESDLGNWIRQGVEFALTFPAK